ncbi:uncharacterized protein LOC107841542 [Capsicum annuum]|uniref:uncharacterized protein LOC107841542 n=1 Tax=Capsicum annuum TaxID=4072 RepID=UPI0007BEE17D|nr:uncharacterized protein LOC107841542 [Capsicum annuum]
MAICLQYVDKKGFVIEAFIGLVHVKDTSALSLKKVIADVLAYHSLTLSYVHGQCYDEASNIQDNKWDPVLKKNIECDSLKEKVDAFCVKHNIPLPNYDEPFANFGRSRRKVVDYTTLYHYRVNVFYKIIDWQELNDRFNEVTSDLLNEVVCLNPVDLFSSFDIKKIVRMTELYPDDFDEFKMRAIENQLVNYIIDVRNIDKRFSHLGGLGELFRKLVETKKHLNYFLVFLLVKFALIPPVTIASVEKAFSIKNAKLKILEGGSNGRAGYVSICL